MIAEQRDFLQAADRNSEVERTRWSTVLRYQKVWFHQAPKPLWLRWPSGSSGCRVVSLRPQPSLVLALFSVFAPMPAQRHPSSGQRHADSLCRSCHFLSTSQSNRTRRPSRTHVLLIRTMLIVSCVSALLLVMGQLGRHHRFVRGSCP